MKSILGAIGAMLLLCSATQAEARRSAMSNAPEVDLVADLPDDARFEAYGPDGRLTPLDIGYSYREVSALWMPLFAYEDQGIVFFTRAADGTPVLAEATERELGNIRTLLGRDHVAEYRFPWYRHMWGLLPILAFVGLILFQYRREQKKRYAEGII